MHQPGYEKDLAQPVSSADRLKTAPAADFVVNQKYKHRKEVMAVKQKLSSKELAVREQKQDVPKEIRYSI